jgi:hypothetical protein
MIHCVNAASLLLYFPGQSQVIRAGGVRGAGGRGGGLGGRGACAAAGSTRMDHRITPNCLFLPMVLSLVSDYITGCTYSSSQSLLHIVGDEFVAVSCHRTCHRSMKKNGCDTMNE